MTLFIFFFPFKFECLCYVCYFMVFGSTSGSTGSQLERNFASGWIILWVSPIWLKWYLEDLKGDAGNRRDLGGWLHGIKLLCISTRVECMNWMCLLKICMLKPQSPVWQHFLVVGLWEVIRFRWGQDGDVPMMRLTSLIRRGKEIRAPSLSAMVRAARKWPPANHKEGLHQEPNPSAPWS